MPNDPLGKAIALLEALSPASRERVLNHMDEAHRTQVMTLLRPHDEFTQAVMRGQGMAEQRRLMRQAMMSIHERKMERVSQANEYSHSGVTGEPDLHPAAPIDALDHLRELHPAALAKAMQGERAEAWALVLGRLNEESRTVLLGFIDEPAREAIRRAERDQQALPESIRRTAERALRHTVVPRALREQQLLMTTPLSTMRSTAAR